MTKPKRKLDTRVIRITEHAYNRMKELKRRCERKQMTRLTYSQLLDSLNNVAELMVDGKEFYEVDGKLFDDRAEAWGLAVQRLVKEGKHEPPTTYLCLGADDAFELPRETI